MAFDQLTRNRLARFVSNARALLTEEFTRQLQNDYGLDPATGDVADFAKLKHLDDVRRETARLLRETMEHYLASVDTGTVAKAKKACQEALDRIVREQAFTVLNRFCALRMSEARGLLIESLARGYQSKGFQLYHRLCGTALGEMGDAYRTYLFSVFDEFAFDLPVLFDRFSPKARLFPRETTLLAVLKELNHTDIDVLWAEDETIGWIYQYYNDPEERKKMRDPKQGGSASPRNSRELAVRNQFFTPRYVVNFLTDNTLGRIWYEMTQGQTRLKEQCRYLVRRLNEIFLQPGETAPSVPAQDGLSQEELLNQPVHIPYRPLKDPRDIKMLDPACGSMHFGLYAFDLFEVIYDETWELEEKLGADALRCPPGMKSLHDTYVGKDAFLKDVPRLIIEHNLHGIDIDARCAQIAGLSLWLRAQNAWQRLGLKPSERPTIKRSNIVCAEPMPGEKELPREFVEREFPAEERGVFLRLLEAIFDKMQLAGEAGALLKIEEEIRSAIAEAKQLWKAGPKLEQGKLFSESVRVVQKKIKVDLSGITDEQFWERVEERIYAALRDYAEQVGNGGGFRRRLFAEDAASGFAFIDVCRKRYDVVLMNPPFGDVARSTEQYVTDNYPLARVDLFSCFVESARKITTETGLIGAITNRTAFFITHLEDWRRNLINAGSFPVFIADLGSGVLDAMVEAAAYTIEKSGPDSSLVFKLTGESDKEGAFLKRLTQAVNGVSNQDVSVIKHNAIAGLPKATLAYWLGARAFEVYRNCPKSEPAVLEARMGLRTLDDFRFLRTNWECYGLSPEWIAHCKGGGFSRYYSPIHLRIKWHGNGAEIKALARLNYGSETRTIQAQNYYGRCGITYTQRTTSRLSLRPMVAGGNFSAKGPLIIASRAPANDWLWYLLGLLNSDVAEYLISVGISAAEDAARSYDVGLFQYLPFIEPTKGQFGAVVRLAKEAAIFKQALFMTDETDNGFCPSVLKDALSIRGNPSQFARYTQLRAEIDAIICDVYQIPPSEVDGIRQYLSQTNSPEEGDKTNLASLVISVCVGAIIGLWDIRYATGEKVAPELRDPFAPLPVCQPGQLQNAQGFPAGPEDVPATYPVHIPWDGILVDDQNHPLDIEQRVREVIEIIWKDRAEAIEHEACEILGVKSLRDYFRKPAGFFADHLKRYSKSRRQAPIYWPLSTASGSYTLWIYYHRLTDQTLFRCVNDFVEPRLKQISEELAIMGSKPNRSPAEESELERLSDHESELKDFSAELLQIAKFWKPNLNDGVQITASPLWKLFQYSPWQRRLRKTWEGLEGEKYDWAHLAYSIWPDRVREKCKSDKSLAIAHDLEELYVEPKAASKKKQGQRKINVESEEIQDED